MKTIYSEDDCGYPLCIKISDKILKRLKIIQNEILKPSLQDDEHVKCSKTLFNSESFKISTHIKTGCRPYLEIRKDNISLYLSGYEDSKDLIDFKNFLKLPNIFFSDQFVSQYNLLHDKNNFVHNEKHFKSCLKKIPKNHIKILKKLCKKQKEIENAKQI